MTWEKAKKLFRNDVDSYGKLDEIFDDFEKELEKFKKNDLMCCSCGTTYYVGSFCTNCK